MREYLITLLISAALCYLITPIVRSQAIRFGAVAAIRDRDIHSVPTARWGGVAMWASMALTFAIVNHLPLVGKSFGHETQGIFLAATAIVLLGMADDRFELDSLTKLAGQVFVAGILLIYGIQILWLPINGVITLPPSIGQLLTVLIVVVVINAVNFIDGMDGLAAGIVAISGIAFFAFAYLLAVDYGFSRAGAPSLTTAVLVGICLGNYLDWPSRSQCNFCRISWTYFASAIASICSACNPIFRFTVGSWSALKSWTFSIRTGQAALASPLTQRR